MGDSTQNGQPITILNGIDDYKRQAVVLQVGLSLPSPREIRALEETLKYVNKPKVICVYNGPEFTSSVFQHFCKQQDKSLRYIQPGKPIQNAFIER